MAMTGFAQPTELKKDTLLSKRADLNVSPRLTTGCRCFADSEPLPTWLPYLMPEH